MQTVTKYKPTGSKEVDEILIQAYKRIEESNEMRKKIHLEVNSIGKEENAFKAIIKQIFRR